jgi:hypothetical protein
MERAIRRQSARRTSKAVTVDCEFQIGDLSLLQFHSKTFLKSGDRSGLEPSLRWLQAPTENRGSCCLPTPVQRAVVLAITCLASDRKVLHLSRA